jgi:hypothetical protein
MTLADITLASSEEITSGAAATKQSLWLKWSGAKFATWARSCADSYAAASAYDDLRRFSDIELKHCGLSRDILARDLGTALDQQSAK